MQPGFAGLDSASDLSLIPTGYSAAAFHHLRCWNVRTLLKLMFLAVLAAAGWVAWALLSPVTPSGQKFVLLRPVFPTRRTAHELQPAGATRNAGVSALWQHFPRHHSLKAGEYLFERPANSIDVWNRLERGDIYVH